MKPVFKQVRSLLILGIGAILMVGCKPEVSAAKAGSASTESNATAPKSYPLDTCIVADEKLGSMGDPYVFVHEGQELKLCCKGCLKDFNKEPGKYLPKLQAAKKS